MKVMLDIDLKKLRYSLVGDGYTKEEVEELDIVELETILIDRVKSHINDEYNKAKRIGLLD